MPNSLYFPASPWPRLLALWVPGQVQLRAIPSLPHLVHSTHPHFRSPRWSGIACTLVLGVYQLARRESDPRLVRDTVRCMPKRGIHRENVRRESSFRRRQIDATLRVMIGRNARLLRLDWGRMQMRNCGEVGVRVGMIDPYLANRGRRCDVGWTRQIGQGLPNFGKRICNVSCLSSTDHMIPLYRCTYPRAAAYPCSTTTASFVLPCSGFEISSVLM